MVQCKWFIITFCSDSLEPYAKYAANMLLQHTSLHNIGSLIWSMLCLLGESDDSHY